MQLELTDKEVDVLKIILKEEIMNLRAEIRKAALGDYKKELKEKKEILKAILEKLGEEI